MIFRLAAIVEQSPGAVPAGIAVAALLWFAGDEGGFRSTTWMPVELLLLATLFVCLVALPRPTPSRPALIGVALLSAYGLWTLLSVLWAGQEELAWDAGNRTLKGMLVGRRRPARAPERWALQDVSFRLEPGSSTALIGQNGAGKSTLLRLAAGLGRPTRGRVEVDDTVLSDGTDSILACAIGNGRGYAQFDGLPLLTDGDPTDGRVEVAVAVPAAVKRRFRSTRVRVEVRRARGRAVSVLPRDGDLPFLDDGVAGTMSRKRSWWTEPGAWAVYVG